MNQPMDKQIAEIRIASRVDCLKRIIALNALQLGLFIAASLAGLRYYSQPFYILFSLSAMFICLLNEEHYRRQLFGLFRANLGDDLTATLTAALKRGWLFGMLYVIDTDKLGELSQENHLVPVAIQYLQAIPLQSKIRMLLALLTFFTPLQLIGQCQ